MDIFLILFNMRVCCVFSIESPHRGNSNENTQYTVFNITQKSLLIIPSLQPRDFLQETQEQVRNSRGKLVISVRATEVLLYLDCNQYNLFRHNDSRLGSMTFFLFCNRPCIHIDNQGCRVYLYFHPLTASSIIMYYYCNYFNIISELYFFLD